MNNDWVRILDNTNTLIGEVSPTLALILIEKGIVEEEFGIDLRLKTKEDTKVLGVVMEMRDPHTGVIRKSFTGESADVEIEFLNSDDKVRLERALIGTNKDLLPRNASDQLFKSLDEWLVAIHQMKSEGHRLSCLTAPKERVAVVLDHDTDITYSLPFRHLYATAHGVQPSTVHAWGFAEDPLELLRQVRDHNLRECLIAGKPDLVNGEIWDAQPDEELETLWKDDADKVLQAFQYHTGWLKANHSRRKKPGIQPVTE